MDDLLIARGNLKKMVADVCFSDQILPLIYEFVFSKA